MDALGSDYTDVLRLPRIQFITDDTIMNYAVTAGLGAVYQSVQTIPYGHKIDSMVYDYVNSWLINIQDSFGRRWQPDEDNIPLEAFSIYPGAGHKYYPKVNRVLTDPMLEKRPDMDIPSDTNLQLRFTKTIAPAQTLNLAFMCQCPWESPYTEFPRELHDDSWWAEWRKRRIKFVATVPTNNNGNGLNGVNLTTSYRLQVTGDVLVYGITFTGGANILVGIRSSQQSTPAGYITTSPVRVDLLGPCRLNPGGYNPQEFRWPGVYYIQRGKDLIFDFQSLAGLGVPITELITVHGWVLDWGRY